MISSVPWHPCSRSLFERRVVLRIKHPYEEQARAYRISWKGWDRIGWAVVWKKPLKYMQCIVKVTQRRYKNVDYTTITDRRRAACWSHLISVANPRIKTSTSPRPATVVQPNIYTFILWPILKVPYIAQMLMVIKRTMNRSDRVLCKKPHTNIKPNKNAKWQHKTFILHNYCGPT